MPVCKYFMQAISDKIIETVLLDGVHFGKKRIPSLPKPKYLVWLATCRLGKGKGYFFLFAVDSVDM